MTTTSVPIGDTVTDEEISRLKATWAPQPEDDGVPVLFYGAGKTVGEVAGDIVLCHSEEYGWRDVVAAIQIGGATLDGLDLHELRCVRDVVNALIGQWVGALGDTEGVGQMAERARDLGLKPSELFGQQLHTEGGES